jgi:thiol-disulfide isomerase/thioredoxin
MKRNDLIMTPQNQPPKSSWTITRFGLIGSVLILVAAIAYTFYQGDSAKTPFALDSTSNGAASVAGPSAPPEPLPESVMQASINMLDGKKAKLADYSGKVLVLDVWATWCGPCKQEIPYLVEIAKDYKSRGVEVIGLTNEDPKTDTEVVKDFSKSFNINYPIGWADEEMQAGLMRAPGIPQTYIIGRDGKVLKHFVGFTSRITPPRSSSLDPKKLKAAIEEAVGSG